LTRLHLHHASLEAVDVMDALVDAALECRPPIIVFDYSFMLPVSVPSLVRLLGSGGALRSLLIDNDDAQLLDGPAAALLGGALRMNNVLESLTLRAVRLWHDFGAATTLLTSLVAHPSLRELDLSANEVAPAQAACAGSSLFALVAANAPALTELDVECWRMGDAGLRPLMEALPRNTHLRALIAADNDMSEAFARDVLLPAVRANTSLTDLQTGNDGVGPHVGAVEAQAIVARRAAALRGRHRGALRW
jgi:hypothetical protein